MEEGKLAGVNFNNQAFPINADLKDIFQSHGIPNSLSSSPKRFSIHKHFIALAWPSLNKIIVIDMEDFSVKHVIGTAGAKDVGADESEIGARVLKIGAFHND